jgi:hypothetical protein
VEGGRKSRANARAKTDSRVLSKAHEVLAENKRKSPPSCWNAAGTIAERLNHKPQQKRVADILAGLPASLTTDFQPNGYRAQRSDLRAKNRPA